MRNSSSVAGLREGEQHIRVTIMGKSESRVVSAPVLIGRYASTHMPKYRAVEYVLTSQCCCSGSDANVQIIGRKGVASRHVKIKVLAGSNKVYTRASIYLHLSRAVCA